MLTARLCIASLATTSSPACTVSSMSLIPIVRRDRLTAKAMPPRTTSVATSLVRIVTLPSPQYPVQEAGFGFLSLYGFRFRYILAVKNGTDALFER